MGRSLPLGLLSTLHSDHTPILNFPIALRHHLNKQAAQHMSDCNTVSLALLYQRVNNRLRIRLSASLCDRWLFCIPALESVYFTSLKPLRLFGQSWAYPASKSVTYIKQKSLDCIAKLFGPYNCKWNLHCITLKCMCLIITS